MLVKLLMLVCALQATLYARVVSIRGKKEANKVEVISSSISHFQYGDNVNTVNLTSAETNAVIGGAVGHADGSEKLWNDRKAISSKPASAGASSQIADEVTKSNPRLNEWLRRHANGFNTNQVETNFRTAIKTQELPSLKISDGEATFTSFLGKGMQAIALRFGDYVLKWHSHFGSLRRRPEIEMLRTFHDRGGGGSDAVVKCLNTADDGLYVVTSLAPGQKIRDKFLTWEWTSDNDVVRFAKLMQSWLNSIHSVYSAFIENNDQDDGNTMYDEKKGKITFFDFDRAVDENPEKIGGVMTSEADMLKLAKKYAKDMIDEFVTEGKKTLKQFPWWPEGGWQTQGSNENPHWKCDLVKGYLGLFDNQMVS